jgi:hypothetical protein
MAALFYPFAKELSVVATPGFHKAIKLLSNWMQRDEWRAEFLSVLEDHIDPACEEFNVAMEYLEDEIGWEFAEMATACAVEDFFTAVYEPGGRNLIEDYLKRRGWKESAPVKNCLHALRRSVASLYEVTETVPKSHLFVRDLVRGGEPIRLDDREMASLVVKWDRFAMRLMNIRGKFHATTTVLDFPIEESDELLAELRKYVALAYETPGEEDRAQDANPAETRRMMEEATLRDAAPLITDYWLRGIFRMLGRPPRRFVNFEGHDLLFGEARFPIIVADRRAVEQGLDGIEELEPADPEGPSWQWIGGSSAAPLENPDKAISTGSFSESGEAIRGMVEISEREVVLTANSRERTERGIAMLEERLAGLLGRPLVEYLDIADVREDGDASRSSMAEPLLSPAEQSAIMHEFLDRHYNEVISRPVPALGGMSPREASQGSDGRVALLSWLKQLENMEARRAADSGTKAYDTAWLWDELDMTDLRK